VGGPVLIVDGELSAAAINASRSISRPTAEGRSTCGARFREHLSVLVLSICGLQLRSRGDAESEGAVANAGAPQVLNVLKCSVAYLLLMAARRLRVFVCLSIIGRFEAQLRSAPQKPRHPLEPSCASISL
jgi:hypothetical protein